MFRVVIGCFAVCLLAASSLQAQIQASCNFKVFSLNPSNPNNPATHPSGVNDNDTVVGYGDYPQATPGFKAFVRKSGGSTTYWLPQGALWSGFSARNNNGSTVGGYVDSSRNAHAVLLQGSTVTQIVHPNSAAHSTGVSGINKFNNTVGSYTDPKTGNQIGFKRYSGGGFVDFKYPGATQTLPAGINDNGAIVGTYIATDNSNHGFVYRNGTFAKLDYPASNSATNLEGISDAGIIVGDAGASGSSGPVSFMYKNGVFKRIADPNLSPSATIVRGISAGGIITGELVKSGNWYGFTAICQ